MTTDQINISNKYIINYDQSGINQYDSKYFMRIKNKSEIQTTIVTMTGILKYIKKNGDYSEYCQAEKFFMDKEL